LKRRFCIVTHVVHKFHQGSYYGYAPYIREMNIWNNYADEVIIVAPLVFSAPSSIDAPYNFQNIKFVKVPEFNLIGYFSLLQIFWKVPYILIILFCTVLKSNHIHLRTPGNMGLLGTFVQILFPNKKKTAKYAGNWDWKSVQPWSYRVQQRILRNTFLTRNIQVLVYGDWNETENIRPFFTASYSEIDIIQTPPRLFSSEFPVKLLFVGSLSQGKRPMISLNVLKKLNEEKIPCEINLYGDGKERKALENYIIQNNLGSIAFLHGNVSAELVKESYQNSHFLIFISQSEGWPKVVAESMFWGCLPLTTAVSCVPEMIGHGMRGDIVEPSVQQIVERIKYYLLNPTEYNDKCLKAMDWSRQYTLEKLESGIKSILN